MWGEGGYTQAKLGFGTWKEEETAATDRSTWSRIDGPILHEEREREREDG